MIFVREIGLVPTFLLREFGNNILIIENENVSSSKYIILKKLQFISLKSS